jgi:electron transport complex protein RnfC
MNDPFTGKALFDLDTPIEKGSRSLIALLPEEVHSGVAKPCIRCGHCSQVCPESLEPFLLYKAITSEISIASDELEARGLSACIGCAACAYVCPSRIPLAHAITVSQRRAARERRMNEA